jgi:hypothetical protein
LAALQREGIRVHGSDQTFTLAGRQYSRGTLIIKIKDNPNNLYEKLSEISQAENVEIISTNSSWVDDGVNFGSGQVNFLEKPKIALAYNTPVSSTSAGWTRYLIEQAYNYPVTIIHTEQLSNADLSKYNVIILPEAFGSYDRPLGDGSAIKDWIRRGGTLITYGNATQWLTGEKVGLLATTRELKGGKPDEKKDKDEKPKENKPDLTKPFDVEREIQPDKELPSEPPGTIVRIALDAEHWLAFGYDGDANVLVNSRNIFTPLKLDKGTNVGLYMPEDKLVLSGFIWEDSKKQLANKAYLMYQAHGDGHVVAFAEDPNTRAFFDGTNLLLMNAIFLGPAH